MSNKTEPSVCAIMLTANRPEMARQAVESFRRQTYANKRLLIWDSGEPWLRDSMEFESGISDFPVIGNRPATIGILRNEANSYTEEDILIHFDSDDLSHANRIAEQVQLLQSSGADAVGYNECLFWREPTVCLASCGPDRIADDCPGTRDAEAWLYTSTSQNEAIGSSLCYWRHVWQRKPFQPTSQGEDAAFQIGLEVATVSALTFERPVKGQPAADPMMLCRIHSGNTSNAYTAENMRAAEWRRVPEWDSFCRSEFAK